MATLTLKNVPDEVIADLKVQAARNARSMNREAIARLKTDTRPEPITVEELRAHLADQASRGIWVLPEDVERSVNEGRR